METKRKYYIWDANRKEFVGDFWGCVRSSTNKKEVEDFLRERQEYESAFSTEEQLHRIETGLSWKYCYIMLLTEKERIDFENWRKEE